uniref:Uncharacterized protein n=1 Tax=Arundo donax TaxID=35708 RepID=A0A0A9BXF3_ARUDO
MSSVVFFPLAIVKRPTWPSLCCVVARSTIFGIGLGIFPDHFHLASSQVTTFFF